MDQYTCPHCDDYHSTGARFCPRTGKPIPLPEKICPKCKKEMLIGWEFCPYCSTAKSPFRKAALWIGIFFLLLIIGGFFLWSLVGGNRDRSYITKSSSPPPIQISVAENVVTVEANQNQSSVITERLSTSTLTPSPSPTVTSTATIIVSPTPMPTVTKVITTTEKIPDQEIFTAYYLAAPPVIDGSLNDWQLPQFSITEVTFGREYHKGLSDSSAQAMLGWNEKYLFIALQIQDDTYAQNASEKMLYKGDHVEILLDKGVNTSKTTLSENHFQLGLSLGPDLQFPETYLWYPVSKRGSVEVITSAGTRTSSGYTLEAKIPWEVFNGKPESGHYYGFSLSVGDNDDPSNNMMKSLISSAPERKLANPTTWGKIKFAEQETKFFGFVTCREPCMQNASNANDVFSEKTKKIYARWRYENVPVGANYVRKWSMDGKEWVRYECSWQGPETGFDEVTLTEPKGLHSGIWQIEIFINNERLLHETITVEGN
jgi:hypothetical protein